MEPALTDTISADPTLTPELIRALIDLVKALGPIPFVLLVLGYLALRRVDVWLAHSSRASRKRQAQGVKNKPLDTPNTPQETKDDPLDTDPKGSKD